MSSKSPDQTDALPSQEAIPAWRPPSVKNRGGSSPHVEKAIADVRSKIHPRSVKGLYANWRIIMVVITQLLFYGLPWLQWNGRQAVLFDLAARKFYIFGMVLWPQDIIYLAVLLVLSAFSLFLFTAIAGRLFCGYACPQTVYTQIFMWVERRIEGDRVARIRLDEEPMSWRKFRLKASKHILWIVIAWWTGSTFIGYFAPIRELGMGLLHFDLGPWQWFWMAFYAFATWGNAGFLREAVCKYMCPYARFQSAMVDDDTFVVTYDYVRGDPRGGRSRRIDHKEAGMGDCVDCTLCVQVCPTGIDIRDTSGRAIVEGMSQSQVRKRMFRPRVIAYTLVLAAIGIAFAVSLATRTTLRMDIIRDRGMLGREVTGGLIENVYRLQLMNAAETPLTLHLGADGIEGVSIATPEHGTTVHLAPASNQLVPIVIRAPAAQLEPGMYDIRIHADGTTSGGQPRTVSEATSFYVPQ